jgi:hypothetical protein
MSTYRNIVKAAVFASSFASADAMAFDDSTMTLSCAIPSVTCMMAGQTIVGRIIGQSQTSFITSATSVERIMGGQKYRLELDGNGFFPELELYYRDSACKDGPFWWTGNWDFNGRSGASEGFVYFASATQLNGGQIWGPVGPTMALAPQGYQHGGPSAPCTAINGNLIAVHNARVLETKTFSLPFTPK